MPYGVFVSADSVVEEGAILTPPVYICNFSHICRGARIMPFSYVDGSYVGENTIVLSSVIINSNVGGDCSIGPYAYLREGAKIGKNCKIGDFVEVKNSVVGENAKAAHHAYIGDADIGKNVNLGCGVVFCNYDGRQKHRCKVGDNAFIGCNCNLVAPLEIGRGAYIAAGTTVTDGVGEDDFCVGRARQIVKKGGAAGRYGAGGDFYG